MFSTYSWFQISAYVMDGYYVNRSMWAEKPHPDIMTSRETFLIKKIDYFTSKKLSVLFFFVFGYFCSNSFVMFVWKKTKNLIVANWNLLLKIFCCSAKKNEGRGLKPPLPPPPHASARPCLTYLHIENDYKTPWMWWKKKAHSETTYFIYYTSNLFKYFINLILVFVIF